MAAVAAAEGTGEPPPELELAFENRDFGGLPEAGGLMDQPAGLLKRMRIAMAGFTAWRRWLDREAGKEGEFAERYPRDWAIVKDVMEMRHGQRD